jgi:glycosyltransferase involved in cell wall biosynthesis/GT2 family glycosyltransferase
VTTVRLSVVVPTYRRPDRLRACLRGLAAQVRPADEVVVVRRRDDEESRAVLAGRAGAVREVLVVEPGLAAALYAGLRAAEGPVIAVTDDDAVPRPDWLARIEAHFADPRLGVLGGRDQLGTAPVHAPSTVDVGRIGRWGRLVGNHHRGTGPVRDVDVVKGVNFAVRRAAAAVPVGLRGTGAQPHSEVALCRWAAVRGWRIAYDPALVVDHFAAARPAGDRRTARRPADVSAEAYNLVAALLSERGELLARRAVYGLLVGDRAVPGLLRAGYGLVRRDAGPVRALLPSLAGQLAALRDQIRGRPLAIAPVACGPPPLRVTLVAHDVHDRGGMERALAELIRRAGPRVAFTVVSGTLAPELRRRVVRWRRVPVPRRPFPLRYLAFHVLGGLLVGRRSGQLVHTCGAIVPNRVDVASVHQCHAGLVAATGRLTPPGLSAPRRFNTALTRVLSLAAERWTYGRPRTRSLAVVSSGLAAEVHAHYPAPPVVVTPNGVDVHRFVPDPAVRARLRAGQRVPEDATVALFVGGNWEHKGLPLVVDAIGRSARAGLDVRLWVVGPGDESRYRGAAGVTFFGPRDDVADFYRAADLLVLPTLYETFSLVAHEAAAAGLPVVATPVTGLTELIGRDEAGVLVERTPESVAGALARLAGDPGLGRRLGAEGRRRVAGRTWDAGVDETVALYRRLRDPVQGVPRVR